MEAAISSEQPPKGAEPLLHELKGNYTRSNDYLLSKEGRTLGS